MEGKLTVNELFSGIGAQRKALVNVLEKIFKNLFIKEVV